MRKGWMALGLAALASTSCKRLLGHGTDAGDSGILPISDAGQDAPPRFDGPPGDVAIDVPVVVDGRRDTPVDVGPAICPAGAPPVDVCGCGCCGPGPMGRACYYPSRGERPEDIPNSVPSASECAAAGCSFGVRHECCADPGAQPSLATFCGNDQSGEDLPIYTFTKSEGGMCTTLQIGYAPTPLPITVPAGLANATGWRQPCDGSGAKVNAIGGLGSVTPSAASFGSTHYDVHVVLFFDAGTGIAEAVRIDVDGLAISPGCAGGLCPPCAISAGVDGGTCSFDATYSYGYVGGRVRWRDYVVLSPPDSFTHIHTPVTTMPADFQCAPPIPPCYGPALDVADVNAALADPDVVQAFSAAGAAASQPPLLYGVDSRAFDGQVFSIEHPAGAGFLVGGPCPPGSATSCREIPGGIGRMVAMLMAFDQQQIADPSCVFPSP